MPPFSYARAALTINSTNIGSGTPGMFLKVGNTGLLEQSYPPALSGAQNLKGEFDNTNNTLTVDADAITLVNTNGEAVNIVNPGASITCDIDTAGPIINGRDQVAAFAAADEVHFYWIWDGTTLATIASLAAPPTGPAMPAGYTFFAYIATQKLTGTPKVLSAQLRGNILTFDRSTAGISLGISTAGAEQTLNLRVNGGVPTIAQQIKVILSQLAFNNSAGGTAQGSWLFRAKSGVLNTYATVAVNYALGSPSTTETYVNGCELQMPNPVNGNIYYLLTNTTGSGQGQLDIAGFTVPNNAS